MLPQPRTCVATPMTSCKRIRIHFDVMTDDEAAELSLFYEDVIAGKRTRVSFAADDT